MEYIFKNGRKVVIEDIDEKYNKQDKYFKVNLPYTEENFKKGNGEGCWAYTSDEFYKKIETTTDEIAFVILLNDSFYYNGLNYGTLLPVETRGNEYRPVALYDELNHKYRKITQEAKNKLLEMLCQTDNN